MGYDLHITRRKLWCDEGKDITFEEFVGIIKADPEFAYPGQLGADSADWRSPQSGYESWLTWTDGDVYTKNPEKEYIEKLVEVAKVFCARVQGDDGEIYLSATNTFEEPLDTSTLNELIGKRQPSISSWPLGKKLIAAFLLGCALLALKILLFGI